MTEEQKGREDTVKKIIHGVSYVVIPSFILLKIVKALNVWGLLDVNAKLMRTIEEWMMIPFFCCAIGLVYSERKRVSKGLQIALYICALAMIIHQIVILTKG